MEYPVSAHSVALRYPPFRSVYESQCRTDRATLYGDRLCRNGTRFVTGTCLLLGVNGARGQSFFTLRHFIVSTGVAVTCWCRCSSPWRQKHYPQKVVALAAHGRDTISDATAAQSNVKESVVPDHNSVMEDDDDYDVESITLEDDAGDDDDDDDDDDPELLGLGDDISHDTENYEYLDSVFNSSMFQQGLRELREEARRNASLNGKDNGAGDYRPVNMTSLNLEDADDFDAEYVSDTSVLFDEACRTRDSESLQDSKYKGLVSEKDDSDFDLESQHLLLEEPHRTADVSAAHKDAHEEKLHEQGFYQGQVEVVGDDLQAGTVTEKKMLGVRPKVRYLWQVPQAISPEVVFIGRSNAGKSTLLNTMLASQEGDAAAPVSSKAGRTRTLNWYPLGFDHPVGWERNGKILANQPSSSSASGVCLIDCFGLGPVDYSSLRSKRLQSWAPLLHGFLKQRRAVTAVLHLVSSEFDGRLTEGDEQLLEIIRKASAARKAMNLQPFRYFVVLTKTDLFPENKINMMLQSLRRKLRDHEDLRGQVIQCSSLGKEEQGIATVSNVVNDAAARGWDMRASWASEEVTSRLPVNRSGAERRMVKETLKQGRQGRRGGKGARTFQTPSV